VANSGGDDHQRSPDFFRYGVGWIFQSELTFEN
jgi:hypothetical protein